MEGFRGRILRKDFGRIRGRILAEGKKEVYEINHSNGVFQYLAPLVHNTFGLCLRRETSGRAFGRRPAGRPGGARVVNGAEQKIICPAERPAEN